MPFTLDLNKENVYQKVKDWNEAKCSWPDVMDVIEQYAQERVREALEKINDFYINDEYEGDNYLKTLERIKDYCLHQLNHQRGCTCLEDNKLTQTFCKVHTMRASQLKQQGEEKLCSIELRL